MRDHWEVEKYHEHEIYVDGKGVFFTLDEDRKRHFEAESVAAVRAKLRTITPLNIPAMKLGWHDNRETFVTIHGISGLGNLLYTDGSGNKHRQTRYEKLYVRDDERYAKLKDLQKAAEVARKAAEKMIQDWPLVTVPK